MTRVLTPNDIAMQGDTLVTFLWLAVLFAFSGQLNELASWAGRGSGSRRTWAASPGP